MKLTKPEQGQTLIQLALAMVVLLGFAALAIDLGNAYVQRRRMQNAADAAVLAGARELCLASEPAVAKATAEAYLVANGVSVADAAAGVPLPQDGLVEAVAKTSADVVFGGALGLEPFNVSASAAARCGAATSACGLIPLALDITLWNGVGCGDQFMVWTAENQDLADKCPGELPDKWCEKCYVCEYKGVPFEIMTDLSRGWVDFSSLFTPPYIDTCTGGGTNELNCRMKNGAAAPIDVGACVPSIAGSGTHAGAKEGIEYLKSAGKVASIPLYDDVNCKGEANEDKAESFVVAGFGCIEVVDWVQNYSPVLRPGGTSPAPKSHVIFVKKNCTGSCMNFCGSASDATPQPGQLRSVSIVQ